MAVLDPDPSVLVGSGSGFKIRSGPDPGVIVGSGSVFRIRSGPDSFVF